MKVSKFAQAVLTTFALYAVSHASAMGATSLYGDKDGFGVGIAPNQSFTGVYPNLSKNDAADVGTITDEYLDGDQTWSHTYDISGLGTIDSVFLEMLTYAQGWHGISNVYFDNVLVGQLTDGDSSTAFLGTNWARLDVFDLSLFGPFTGVNSIRIDTASPNDDRWALDYSELRINVGPSSKVPEPASATLVGLGLAGLLLARRRRTEFR